MYKKMTAAELVVGKVFALVASWNNRDREATLVVAVVADLLPEFHLSMTLNPNEVWFVVLR